MIIGGAIRKLRLEQNVTQRDLAQRAGISGSLLSDVERGTVMPSLKTAMAIAEALQVPVSVLVDSINSVTG